MRSTLALLTLISLSFLTGCGSTIPADDLLWVKPIYFHPDTIEWLEEQEWPDSAYSDFDQINKHNEKVRAFRAWQRNTSPRPAAAENR